MKFEIKKSGTKTIRIINDKEEFMGELNLKLDKGNYELIMILDNNDKLINLYANRETKKSS